MYQPYIQVIGVTMGHCNYPTPGHDKGIEDDDGIQEPAQPHDLRGILESPLKTYCGWKKSCSSQVVNIPFFIGLTKHPFAGAGFRNHPA